ncbi:MAG: aspartate/glutamate racemase family protein [Candidatus Desulforudis sp.]|nr:aspartate/glutamate racemase family protein [Desulforudis sp.]
MKTIGLIGGMSWESSALYYRIINETVRNRLAGLRSARIILYSLDFADIEMLQRAGDWAAAGRELGETARRLERAGADFVLICTNTMHKVADVIAAFIDIPLLHIADATAEEIKSQGLQRVGLLGTSYTMEDDFYRGRLTALHGLDVQVPNERERRVVHGVIYDELCQGIARQSSREAFREIMAGLGAAGAQAIILGCTEIALLVDSRDTPLPLFDTARIHAEKAVHLALE